MRTTLLSMLLLATSFLQGQNLKKGIDYYENQNYGQSKSLLKSINSDHQDFAQAQYYLGRMSFDEGDYEDAQEYFEEAIDENNEVTDYHLWLGNAYGVEAQDANVIKQGYLAPKIKNAYERAVELDPKNIDAQWGLVQYYTQAPGFMGGSWEKAGQSARSIYKIDAVQGHRAMALVYLGQDKFDLAENEHVKAAEKDPSSNYDLGMFYQNRKQYEKAFQTFEKALTLNPDDINSMYQIGRTSVFSGLKMERGLKCLNKYLQYKPSANQPSHAGALMRIAMIYENRGDKLQAKNYYRLSLKKDPELKESKEGLARVI